MCTDRGIYKVLGRQTVCENGKIRVRNLQEVLKCQFREVELRMSHVATFCPFSKEPWFYADHFISYTHQYTDTVLKKKCKGK